ncbi:disulfide bond formation protein DsbA [Chryseobacterium artocarpi]|uniref:Disulfide bond formation protein DsbA n=2 Tax=Chryseobacterium artocarpi TaxID=1414727 RepID=A0A1B8ZC25_9FLAO|nr:disulfide bond formation protein DsbA [Chryseobacterium artocarpi]
MENKEKMKIKIWSDIMCPFCYIGKRNIEQALSNFPEKQNIEIEWKSFQLDPSIPEIPKYQDDIYRFVAQTKGISYEQSKSMHEHVVKMAEQSGLEYHFDKILVTNSLKSHILIQLAKTKGLASEAEEKLFYSYFTLGKNLNDINQLTVIGEEIGIKKDEIEKAFNNDDFVLKVKKDRQEALAYGMTGVPLLVINGKHVIVGAQQPEEILKTISKAYQEWKSEQDPNLKIQYGASCDSDGSCQ